MMSIFSKLFRKQPIHGEHHEPSPRDYISDTFPEYHHDIIFNLHKKYSLSGKKILDVGGSNIPVDFMRSLGVKQFICLDPVTKWGNFHKGNTLDAEIFGKRVYSKDNFPTSLDREFCFIIDIDIEEASELFENYFDFIISISTFEHVSDINRCLEIIYKFLVVGGILHSQYEPVFSSPAGHHCYIDENINFVTMRQLDNMHLLYTKDEAREFMRQTFKWSESVENVILEAIYDSSIINRKTLNDHINEIMNSPFNKYGIEYFYRMPSERLVQEKLVEKYGFMRFDVRGIKLRCVKD